MDDIHKLIQLVPELRERPVHVEPLSGGLTNRNYRVAAGGESYVVRIGGENSELLGIDRACEAACSRAAAALGVGPEVIAYLPQHSALVTRLAEGRVLTPEDIQQPAILRRVVEALRRYHDGSPGAGRFSPFDCVRNYHALARERQVDFPANLGEALERLRRIEQALGMGERRWPCHNDLLPSNLLDDGAAVRIIDWEYAGLGDRFFDLGNLAANNLFQEEHERSLLALYFGQVRSKDLERLRLMRLASDMREAMWGFLQVGISTLQFDYQAYGRKHLERFLAAAGNAPH